MTPLRRRATGALLLALMLVPALAGCSGDDAKDGTVGVQGPDRATPAQEAPPKGSVRVVAVGDISCDPGFEPGDPSIECQDEATADLTSRRDPDVVIGLGDLQYEAGELEDFESTWTQRWGRFDDILSPVPGNHEYKTEDAAGYRDYFDAQEGADLRYAEDIGAWRVYFLDSDCDVIDCEEQAQWLSDDLAANPTACTAIATHHARWSSGDHGSQVMTNPLWVAASEGGVDLALSGHDHSYERFARLDVDGQPVADDEEGGTRQFVVGTGGRSLYELKDPIAGSEAGVDGSFGVLDLTLNPTGYDWEFVDVDDEVRDAGSETCSG